MTSAKNFNDVIVAVNRPLKNLSMWANVAAISALIPESYFFQISLLMYVAGNYYHRMNAIAAPSVLKL